MTLDLLVIGATFREVLERGSGETDVRLGGSGLTAAIAAARMGAVVGLASFVGAEDEEVARSLLAHADVRAELVVGVGASGTFVYPEGASDDQPRPLFRPAEASPGALPELPLARALLLFGMPDFDTPSDPAVSVTAERADLVVWDRQGWLSRTRDAKAAAGLGARRRILLTNADEAIDEGILNPVDGVIAVPRGYGVAVVKDGRRGAVVVEGDGITNIPAYPVEVANNLGSGDVFAGVLTARIAAGESVADAARVAAAATSALLESGTTFAPADLSEMADAVRARTDGYFEWRF